MSKKLNLHGLNKISSKYFNIAETLSLALSIYHFEHLLQEKML
jgi:hypothetical protein